MRRLLILLAALALLAAGCGGDGDSAGDRTKPSGPPLSKLDYETQLSAISKQVGESIGKTNQSGRIDEGEIDRLTAGFHRLADRIGELNPPEEVEDLHERLVKAIDDFADAWPGIAKKLNNTGNDIGDAFKAFFASRPVQELIKLGEDFKKKGYDLKLNG